MIRPRTKRLSRRLLPFGLIWMLSGWVFLLVEYAATAGFDQLPATAIQMDGRIFIVSSLAVFSAGVLTGWIELKYLDRWFGGQRFVRRMLYKLLVYTLIFMVLILLTFPLAASLELDTSPTDPRVWQKYLDYFTSLTHLSTGLQLGVGLMLSLFYSEISDFMGPNVLLSFFTGRYHQPVEESRIFMFVDMKSSTAIAERLGHRAYFQLLQAYYRSFSEAIINHAGEIYQYVGDEIILSWPYRPGQPDARPVDCFLEMRDSLRQQDAWFRRHFGLAPTFKAGIHLGQVTTGEIGSIKKEILFSGDVLNATARIQGLCNTYGVDLLLSADMCAQLTGRYREQLSLIGEAELRGRSTGMKLYTLNRGQHAHLVFGQKGRAQGGESCLACVAEN